MADATLVTPEMRAWLGREFDRRTLEVEKGAVRRFAEAIGDPNPLWSDEEAARGTRYGGIIAPPTFLRLATGFPRFPFPLPFEHLLDGGSDWAYFEPVRPGDALTAVSRLVDLREREGRVGRMLFVVHETTYTNQWGRLAASQRCTTILY